MTVIYASKIRLLYGGSFDPIHYGHINAIKNAVKMIKADAVELIPSHIPPHKPAPHASKRDRLAMLEIVLKTLQCEYPCVQFSINPYELEQERYSYTYKTLKTLRENYSQDEKLVWLMGEDSYKHLHQWCQWQSLIEYAHLLVAKRDTEICDIDAQLAAWSKNNRIALSMMASSESLGIAFMDNSLVKLSSSDIRQRLKKNEPITGLLPGPVSEYIEQHQLYKGAQIKR